MKALFAGLIPMLFLVRPGQAQSTPHDSLYYVRLQDGTVLYSTKVELVSSFSRGKYLLLDSNKQVPLSRTSEFKGWDGTFAVGNLGAGPDAYRLQNEGRRISLYSQCYYNPETYYGYGTPNGFGYRRGIGFREKPYYFRKGADGVIRQLNIRNLRSAVADNPSSAGELNIAGVDLHLGIGLVAGGVALVATESEHHHAQGAGALWDFTPGLHRRPCRGIRGYPADKRRQPCPEGIGHL